jgi:transcriptional regulator with XRE-family HTH domain
MTPIEQLLGEFLDEWNAGARPDVNAYLDRAEPADRSELAEQLATWLEIAPTPAYDDATLAEIAADPRLTAAIAKADLLNTPLAKRIPTLREQAGLAVRDVAARLTDAFSLPDAERTEQYVTQLEAGELDERRLSQRLLDRLASILGVEADALAPQPATAGQAFFRADEDADRAAMASMQTLSEAAFAPAPDASLDELDRLFCGGPGA